MRKNALICFVAVIGIVFPSSLLSQDRYDTIYKFPDKKGQNIKRIRGIVTSETKDRVSYKIGLDQIVHIKPELIKTILYRPDERNKDYSKAREYFLKGKDEFDKGKFEDAKEIFEGALKIARTNPSVGKWVGAYCQFYLARSFLEWGMQMEEKNIHKKLVEKRYKNSVKQFKEFDANYPDHRLQIDMPLFFAEALMKLGKDNYDEAISVLDKVQSLSRNPYAMLRKIKVQKLKGDIYKLKGDLDKALEVYKGLTRRTAAIDNPIDEIIELQQDVSVYIGMVYIDKGKFSDAERYFKRILDKVFLTGVTVPNLGRVYFALGKCRAEKKDWEKAQWYFLHGCIAYFDDPEVHRESLLNVIICLDTMIKTTTDKKKRKRYISSLKDYFRQINNSHGGTRAQMEARKIYSKYRL